MLERQEEFRRRLVELGFDQVRFARLDGGNRAAARALRGWLENGGHADMAWMERTEEKRANPELVLPGASSVVVLGINYWFGESPGKEAVWARYALHEDYHDTLKLALQSAGRLLEEMFGATPTDYRYYTDSGPVAERTWAERAGVGFLGKNGMMISRRWGNWLLLAELLTKIPFVPDAPLRAAAGEEGRVGLNCGTCTRCIQACPTSAITAPGVIDARRCISYQTIENKGIIPREFRTAMGDHIYGCDICSEVCPWNRFAVESRRMLLIARHDLAGVTLRELLAMGQPQFAALFRRTPMKRTKLSGLLRNACIVAANTKRVDCLDLLMKLCSHESSVVRAHAVWAVFRLMDRQQAIAQLSNPMAAETDPLVLQEYAAEVGGQTARSAY